MSQRYREHDISASTLLEVILDTGQNAQPVVEVFVKSNAAATFVFSGSSDETNWRENKDLEVVLAAAGEKVKVFSNAFRYIKVETVAANNNEIEIVATG